MWYSDPLFGVVLTLGVFLLARYVHMRTGLGVLNPLLLSVLAVIAVLLTLDIPYGEYQKGGQLITFFIKPATVALAIPLYKHYDVLVRNLKPVLIGITTGVLTSIGSVLVLCRVLGLNRDMSASLLSKSITTPIGIEVTKQVGGIVPLAIAAIIFTGIFGALIGEGLLKVLRIDNKTAQGIAMGTSAHVIGTSKAISMGEEIGAMSAIAIPIAGILTVLLGPGVFWLVM